MTQPVEESHNPVNRIKLHADVISNSYKSTIHLDGGCGDAIGDNLIHFNFELEKELTGRDLKDREFTFKLLDVTDGAIQVVRETVDNQVKLVAKVSYPEDGRYL